MDRNLIQVAYSLINLMEIGKLTVEEASPYMKRFGFNSAFASYVDIKNALYAWMVSYDPNIALVVIANTNRIRTYN